ncbi:MAG: ABC transporter ATP-binding protein [Planctomycetes bacterium]|nr:ABC transporter ATP-binding protein [Planctomycetota bacterium]
MADAWMPEEDESTRWRPSRREWSRLAEFVSGSWRLFGASLAILTVLFGIDILGPWVLKHFIDGPLQVSMRGGVVETSTWTWWIGIYVSILAMSFVLNMLQIVIVTKAGQSVVRNLRIALFSHLLFMSPDYFERTQTGRLVTRISSDCENLSELFTTGVVSTLVDICKIIGLLVACFIVSPSLAVVLLFAAPLLVLLAMLFYDRARRAYRAVRGTVSRLTGWFAEATTGVRVTRIFGREDLVFSRYAALNARTRKNWVRTILLFGFFFGFLELGSGSTQAILLWPASDRIPDGRLTYGEFFQFWSYFALMVGPIRELGEKYNVIQSAFASAERIFGILDQTSTIPEAESPIAIAPGACSIKFEHVDFSYVEGTPVLRDMDFEVEAGSTVAIVGSTGAGKTTLIQLLARFRDANSGRVLVSDQDVRDLDLRKHRRRIGIVLQDVFLFASDILENVRLGDPAISEERVVRALEAVQATELVERAGGIRAKVEERGATLSQGERQLLAFARALVHDPQILILDEATANVDTPTERKIQTAMERVMRGRTTLVIAHRLSTVRHADRILVLERGRLIESGTHDQLLEQGGRYAELAAGLADQEH